MFRFIRNVIRYKRDPIRSAAGFAQGLVLKQSNPPVLIPESIAVAMAEQAHHHADIIKRVQPSVAHAECVEERLRTLAYLCVVFIQGSREDLSHLLSIEVEQNQWLMDSLRSEGIAVAADR